MKKYSIESMQVILAEQASSGMSKKAFCKSRGILPQVFYYWLKKINETHGSGSFISLQTRDNNFSIDFVIEYPNGVKISIPKSLPKHEVIDLIKLW